MKIKIYLNIRTGNYSIMAGGKVIARVDSFTLLNPTFKVNAKIRDRIRETKHKKVHAFICGEAKNLTIMVGLKNSYKLNKMNQATYNPYKYDNFVDRFSLTKIEKADLVVGLKNGNLFYE